MSLELLEMKDFEAVVSQWMNNNPGLSPKYILLDTLRFQTFSKQFYPKVRVPDTTPAKIKSLHLSCSIEPINILEVNTDQALLEVVS